MADAEAAVEKARKAVEERERAVSGAENEIASNTLPGDGIFEVGVDMKSGTYRTTAADSGNCYHGVNADANGEDIKTNNNTSGPSVVTLRDGEFFETSGCNEWVLSR